MNEEEKKRVVSELEKENGLRIADLNLRLHYTNRDLVRILGVLRDRGLVYFQPPLPGKKAGLWYAAKLDHLWRPTSAGLRQEEEVLR